MRRGQDASAMLSACHAVCLPRPRSLEAEGYQRVFIGYYVTAARAREIQHFLETPHVTLDWAACRTQPST